MLQPQGSTFGSHNIWFTEILIQEPFATSPSNLTSPELGQWKVILTLQGRGLPT